MADLVAHGHEVVAVDRATPGTTQPGTGGIGAAPSAVPTTYRGTGGPQGSRGTWGQPGRGAPGARSPAPTRSSTWPPSRRRSSGPPIEVFATNTGAPSWRWRLPVSRACGRVASRRPDLAARACRMHQCRSRRCMPPWTSDHPNIGSDPYALSKEVDERDAAMMHRRHGYQVVALRISGDGTHGARTWPASRGRT